jgi:hypothetical protein
LQLLEKANKAKWLKSNISEDKKENLAQLRMTRMTVVRKTRMTVRGPTGRMNMRPGLLNQLAVHMQGSNEFIPTSGDAKLH